MCGFEKKPAAAQDSKIVSSWTGADVGNAGAAGNFSEKNGTFTVNGAGGGMYIAGDACHFVYRPLEGDGEITARAVSMKNSCPNTTLGVMIRETLAYDAKDIFLAMRPNRGYIVFSQARVGEDVESIHKVAKEEGVKFPCWLRLARRGDLFEVSLSPDGKEWRLIGKKENPISKFVYIGLYVCSHKSGSLAETVFDNVAVTGAIPSKAKFEAEVAKTLQRTSGEKPRDPKLDQFDALAKKRRTERVNLVFKKTKKLISANIQGMPPPKEFVTHLKEYEQRPFDGVILTLKGGQRPFARRPWDENKFLDDYEALAAMESNVLRDNFIMVHTSASMDWFDDQHWQSVLHNTRIMAKAALLGNCAGLAIDPEPYGVNLWLYSEAAGNEEKTFEQFHAQVKKRGEEWIKAIEQELPNPNLLFMFLMPTTILRSMPEPIDPYIESVKKDIPRMRYGLLGSFVNGILKGAGPQTVLIDGNENAYYNRKPADYINFARYVREVLPRAFIDEDVKDKYSRQVRVGSSLYPNWYFGMGPRTLSRHMTPEERAKWYEHNVYWALKTADEYVWDWLEGPVSLWRTGETWAADGQVPPLYCEAIRAAKEKIAKNAELGFDSAALFAAVKTRAAEKRPTAGVTGIKPGQAPVIDGKLDDAVWRETKPLAPFIPILSGLQDNLMPTEVKIRYDDKGLYVAFKCMEDRPLTLRSTIVTNDSFFIDGDDNVQIWAAATNNTVTIYRFILNSKGFMADSKCPENPDPTTRERQRFTYDPSNYNSLWQYAVQINADSWTIEARIPWEGIERPPPAKGERISLNLGRYRTQARSGAGERTYWAPVLEMEGDYTARIEPDLFGTVVLE